jgi:hypothetical protein
VPRTQNPPSEAHAGSSPALGTKIRRVNFCGRRRGTPATADAPPGCLSSTDHVCGDLMPDHGRSLANLEGTCVLENVLVGERPAPMLAHMLHPRIDDKVLDVAFGPFRIKEQPQKFAPSRRRIIRSCSIVSSNSCARARSIAVLDNTFTPN